MPELAIPSVGLLVDAVAQLLDGALTVFHSVVEPKPPVDENGRVSAYAVLHPGAGATTRSSLDQVPGQMLWGFQVTCAGGNQGYVGAAIDTVRGRVEGKTLNVDGAVVGRIQPPLGYTPPPMQVDYDVQPPRLFVPLLFEVLAVPA